VYIGDGMNAYWAEIKGAVRCKVLLDFDVAHSASWFQNCLTGVS